MALVSNAVASRDEELRRLMPPPPPRPPSDAAAAKSQAAIVLDEDTYTQQLESIIERDYFPELPKMANQLEWLRAVNSGDIREMQRAQRNIARRRAAAAAAAAAGNVPPTPGIGAVATPGLPLHTPGWGTATPGTGLLRTPAMTPLVGGMDTPSADATAGLSGGLVTDSSAAGGPAAAVGLSLDTFLQRYTSEDNASLQAILAEDNRRKRAKVRHHLDRPDPRDPETRKLLLEGPTERPSDEYGTSGQAPMTLLPAPEPAINTLFYDSSQRPNVPLSDKEQQERAMGPPKAINREGTRLKAPPAAPPPSTAAAAVAALAAATIAAEGGGPAAVAAAAAAAAAAAGLPFGAPMPGNVDGTVGYAPMATPSFEDMLGTPLMTWGDIESTPLRLGADDMPVALDLEGMAGPSFRMQGMPEREQAAHRLAAAKAGSGTATGRTNATVARGSTPLLTALRRGATGTGGGAGATTRGGRGSTPLAVPLSPAARQLAASIKAGLTPGAARTAAAPSSASKGHRHGRSGGGGQPAAASAAAAASAKAAARSAALGSGELDKQLRASYRSTAAVAAASATPGAAAALALGAGHRSTTPGALAAGRAAATGTPLTASGSMAHRPQAAGGLGQVTIGQVAKSVTDDLLKL